MDRKLAENDAKYSTSQHWFWPTICQISLANGVALTSNPETRPILHSPLGLSQGLKSSSTSPQNGAKAAGIAMLFNTKIGIMVQSPTHRTRYIFYGVKNVRYWQRYEFTIKSASMHSSLYYIVKYGQTIWHFASNNFLLKCVDSYVGILHHIHNGSKSSQWAKVNSDLYNWAEDIGFITCQNWLWTRWWTLNHYWRDVLLLCMIVLYMFGFRGLTTTDILFYVENIPEPLYIVTASRFRSKLSTCRAVPKGVQY